MEVHAHTTTPRKKWTHYFWEFLMLFLAVFCGFLAENQREHIVEYKREKQFIVSLMTDLQMDTLWLNRVTESKKARKLNLDSALFALVGLESDRLSINFYINLRKSDSNLYFYPNDGTITQLKNSGGMRLIRNRKIVNLIEEYDRQIKRQELRRVNTKDYIRDFALLLNKVFSGKEAFQNLYDSTFKLANQSGTIKISSSYLDEFIHECINIKRQIESDIIANNYMILRAINLMESIRKEYHIE